LYYNIKKGCLLEGELFVFDTIVNTYLSYILLLCLLGSFCIITAYFFINASEFKINNSKLYMVILLIFFLCFLLLMCFLIYFFFNIYLCIIAKLKLGYLNCGSPGSSGNPGPTGGGEPTGNNPQGPQKGPGWTDSYGNKPSDYPRRRR
jgi:hypothetical protein